MQQRLCILIKKKVETRISFQMLVKLVEALDAGFTVCRDIGDSDPQRMSPPHVADYITNAFSGTNISTHIISEVTVSL